MRIEKDSLGEMEIEESSYYGIHTKRACDNFPILNYKLSSYFIKAYAEVKLACVRTNMELGYIDERKGKAIEKACLEIINGNFFDQFILSPFQGGAGTSTNMNINEVIANRAIEILGGEKGNYSIVHPLDDVNMHQSTNDTYPTALKVGMLHILRELEVEVAKLQEEFQKKEQEFKDIVKLGRTELQDAVPITLGMEFGAYAEAIARDRWRIFKARERIKTVNLGGTAIGTGLGAPRDYIFKVVEHLKRITGLNISRAENLVDQTQNMDSIVEVSAILKAYAVNLLKISNDLRLLSSGPKGGFAEIKLPPRQAGSSIMPGKVNPVIAEAVSQVALRVIVDDELIALASGLSNLDLNQLMPLISHTMFEELELLLSITKIFRERLVRGIEANKEKCMEYVLKSSTIATILVPFLGYEKVQEIVKKAEKTGKTIKEILIDDKILNRSLVEKLLSPKRMYKLGYTKEDMDEFKSK